MEIKLIDFNTLYTPKDTPKDRRFKSKHTTMAVQISLSLVKIGRLRDLRPLYSRTIAGRPLKEILKTQYIPYAASKEARPLRP